jgi:membrane protein
VGRLLARAQASKPWRAWSRYGAARGNVLAGGIAYVAFFSLFPALALGFTVFGLIIGGRLDLQKRVVTYVNDAFGSTLIGLNDDKGFVSMDQLVKGNLLTLAGALAVGLLLFSGLGWVDAMRQGIRSMFTLPDEGNPLLRKLLDVAVLVIVGLGVLASVIVTVALSAATGVVLTWLGVASAAGQLAVQILVELAVAALDIVLFLMFFRVLAQVKEPWGDLLGGAVIGAVGLHVLKLSGGLLLRTASGNKFLASATIVVGLLLWFNLIGRITLFAAAWAATSVADRDERPASAAAPPAAAAVEVAPPVAPTYGQRTVDRTTLAAGAVLGAVLGVAVGGLTRSVRLLGGAARRRAGSDGDG